MIRIIIEKKKPEGKRHAYRHCAAKRKEKDKEGYYGTRKPRKLGGRP